MTVHLRNLRPVLAFVVANLAWCCVSAETRAADANSPAPSVQAQKAAEPTPARKAQAIKSSDENASPPGGGIAQTKPREASETAVQVKIRDATFEVVVAKPDKDPLTYERALPIELLPYSVRTDKYSAI